MAAASGGVRQRTKSVDCLIDHFKPFRNYDINKPSSVEIQREYYAQTASKYNQMHGLDAEHNLALSVIRSELARLELTTILDVGCGTGRGVKYLLDHGFDVTGVEPVEELIEAGRLDYGLPESRLLVGNGEKLPFPDGSFAASMALGVMHHVASPKHVVSEMLRVSTRAVLISDSNRFGQGSILSRWIKFVAWRLRTWPLIDFIRTRGKGYTISDGDGLAYSYSVYDSLDQLAEWADHIWLIPTSAPTNRSWFHPLFTCSHVLLIATRNTPGDDN